MRIEASRDTRRRGPAWAALLAGLVVLGLVGCGRDSAGDEAALEPRVYTDFTEETELFVEFAPLITGEKSTFAAHFTTLDDYRPVTEGTVDVVLSGGGAPTERFRVTAPQSPGIFAPTVAPHATGERNLTMTLKAPGLSVSHDLGPVTIRASREAAIEAEPPAATSAEGEIGFLKEQQWQTAFDIEAVQPRPLRESVSAPATIRASADGEFVVTAASDGRVVVAESFPTLGDTVARGQVLAMLVPRLGVGTDAASLRSELVAARNAAELARTEAQRMQRLLEVEAVSERRLQEAQAALEVAQSQLRAAEQRVSRLGGGSGAGVPLRAPMSGTLAQVHVANGAAVEAGDPLFHIIDRDELWLEVHVAEADAARLQQPTGAAFELPGLERPVEIRVGDNGRLIGVGNVIDPDSRSVPVIFSLDDPDPRIALNQAVQARVFTGQRREALSVPVGAVIDDGGQRVVYVMRGGESFSRVPVRLGARDGNRIEVLEGLQAGDRVVGEGAMQVRLAAATPEAMGHGHAH